jgi:hypothetical protein
MDAKAIGDGSGGGWQQRRRRQLQVAIGDTGDRLGLPAPQPFISQQRDQRIEAVAPDAAASDSDELISVMT